MSRHGPSVTKAGHIRDISSFFFIFSQYFIYFCICLHLMKATKLSAAFRYNNIVLNKESNFILTWYCNAFGSETKGALPSISEC